MILPCIALAVWCISTFASQRAGDMTNSVSARWSDGGISPAQLTAQEEYARQDGVQNLPELTLWENRGHLPITDNADRSTGAAVIELFGHCEEICFEGLLAGVFPARGDTSGCAISEKTAFELWGSRDVLGKTILIDGKVYSIRGVFQGKDGLVLVQQESSSTKSFPNMQLRLHGEGGVAEAQAFLTRFGFSGAQLLDLPLLGWLIKALAGLPAMTLGVHIMIKLLCRGIRLRAFPLLLSGYILPAGIAAGVCLYLSGFPWSVPQRLIPTKWSNFEFWGRTLGTFVKSIKEWLSAAPSYRDMSLWPGVLLTFFLVIGAVVLLAAVLERVSITTGRELVIGCLFSIGVMLLMVVLLAPFGGIRQDTGMWLMPWLWLVVDYWLCFHESSVKPKSGGGKECEDELEKIPYRKEITSSEKAKISADQG